MSSEKEEAKTVTLPTFSGGKKKYAIWWKRFQAYAIIKKFDDALDPNFALPADPKNITGTDEQTLEQVKKVTMNNLAIA